MKLSDAIYNDFVRPTINDTVNVSPKFTENYLKTRTYPMSYGYLIDLIEKVKALEDELALSKDDIADLRHEANINEDKLAAEALKAFWDSKK